MYSLRLTRGPYSSAFTVDGAHTPHDYLSHLYYNTVASTPQSGVHAPNINIKLTTLWVLHTTCWSVVPMH
jgi:hypothetical protein